MRKKVNATMQARKASLLSSNSKMPRWFYSFIPFKVATGGSSQIISLYALQLGAEAGEIGLLTSLSAFASTLGTVFWGKLSDKLLKRKLFILMGFFSVSVFLSALSLVSNFWELILVNALYSFFLASTVSIPIVLLFRNVRKTRWEEGVGKFNKIGGWAWVIGLLLGFILVRFLAFRELLLLFALLNIPAFIIAWKTIREAPVYLHRSNIKPLVNQVIQKGRYLPNFLIHLPTRLKLSPKFRGFYLSSFLFWISSGMYTTQLPVFLIKNGFTSQEVFGLALLNSSTSAMLYQRVGKKLRSRNPVLGLVQGYFFRTLGVFFLLVPMDFRYSLLLSSTASYLLWGYSWSYVSVSSTSFIGRRSTTKEQGSILATSNLVNSTGFVLGSLIGGGVASQIGFDMNFASASVMSFLAMFPLVPLLGISLSASISKRPIPQIRKRD
ncbi:MFS transporter permease [Thermococcus sp. EP1]|uniref:MFS transporter n=1 Tax=Thermococcus sp. EP1 TaxID=1591054 RepID=UPI0006DB03E4|nr:MFS transporter [Thermococcus sp. EP1]KPU63895.1 MFS transporter permease [Thermococcus sp. EP1]